MNQLATAWAANPPSEEKLLLISTALRAGRPALDEFINDNKDGWLGEDGKFARVLAKVIQASV